MPSWSSSVSLMMFAAIMLLSYHGADLRIGWRPYDKGQINDPD